MNKLIKKDKNEDVNNDLEEIEAVEVLPEINEV